MKSFAYLILLAQIAFGGSGYYQNPFEFQANTPTVSIPAKKAQLISKLSAPSDSVNVVEYGAVGDGITDNSYNFQNALQKAKKLYIPKGVYLISQAINIPNGVELIYGEGTLRGSDQYGIFRQSGSISDLTIEGITFDFQPYKDTIFGALYFDGGVFKNITINKCTFKGASVNTNGILLVGKKPFIVDGFRVINSKFVDIRRAAIEILHRTKNPDDISTVKNVLIDKNTFTMKYMMSDFNPAISLSDRVNGAIIRNNYISGYRWGIETARTINTLITNNSIYNTADAINSSAGTIKSIIKNNILESDHRLQFYTDVGTTITNNQIKGTFYLLKSDKMIVQNNTIKSDTSKAVVWIDNSTNTLFTENYIEHNTIGPWDAIRGYGLKSDMSNTINNNRIYIKHGKVQSRNTDGANIKFGNNQLLQNPIKK